MGRPMATSQDFVNWVCSQGIDYRFLKYVLLAEKDTLLQYASGTTHQTIYFPEVKAFHICLPTPKEQGRLAEILSALDDKIELNRRLVETLEALSAELFKNWFVDFGPVHAKRDGRPTGLFDKLAAHFPSNLNGDGLPASWERKSLTALASFLNGLPLQKYPPVEGESFLPVIKIPELRTGPGPKSGRANLQISNDFRVQNGDHLFSWSGSLMHCRWTHGEGALNQHLFKVSPKHDYPSWLIYQVIDHHMTEFKAIASGKAVTMGHIQRHHLDEVTIAVPPAKDLEALDAIMAPLHARIFEVGLQSRTLADLRNTLLPKLISGELRIADAEREIAAA